MTKPVPIGLAVIASLVATASSSAQQRTDSIRPDSVVVLPELTVPIGRLRVGAVPASRSPFPAQSVGGERAHRRGIAGAVAGLPGVTLGSQTGSPSQPDLRVRGFAVSPVVGLPQSVSVFVDGVRVNEADASQVHLSLIPSGAIERVELLRGPVGAFGKNALAGALHVVTRRGGPDATLEIDGEYASFGTARGTLRTGGRRGAYDGLVAAAYGRSDGWRARESSRELSLFGKVGWRGARTDAWLSYTLESDSLEGPGPLPESWIEGGALPPDLASAPSDRRELQYTGGVGDAFRSRLHFVNARLERELADVWSVQSTVFLRTVDFRQGNDNITEPDALGLTDIRSLGSTTQLAYAPSEGVLLVVGAEAVRNRVDIDIRALPNRVFPDVVPSTTELLRTDEDNLAAFTEAWWAIGPRLGVHASLRFDHTALPVEDRLDPADSGHNTFRELSGGLGVSGDLGAGAGLFLGYGRGFRAPVILEVSCADPDDPCQLPFELGPDPPLLPVVSDTWQAGLRLTRPRVRAEAVGYWAEVHDDIFNVVDLETPTRGFFTNLDRTRRVGSELFLELTPIARLPGLTLGGGLAWTRATFESRATLSAPFLDDDEEEETTAPASGAVGAPPGSGPVIVRQTGPEPVLEAPEVEPGDRFPMVPEISFQARAEYRAGRTTVGLDVGHVGAQHLVGDEGNEAPFPKLDGYTLVDALLEREIGAGTLYLEVSNVFDRDHARFGIISRNVRGEEEEVERFLTPGRPRTAVLGLRVRAGR